MYANTWVCLINTRGTTYMHMFKSAAPRTATERGNPIRKSENITLSLTIRWNSAKMRTDTKFKLIKIHDIPITIGESLPSGQLSRFHPISFNFFFIKPRKVQYIFPLAMKFLRDPSSTTVITRRGRMGKSGVSKNITWKERKW